MWDENLITVEVESILGDKIKEGDVVLVDYSPRYQTIPVPKQTIVKILRGDAGKKIFSEYVDRMKQKKAEASDAETERLSEANFHVR